MQRLKTRAQFQAVMAGTTASRTAHFVLHRMQFDAPSPDSNGPGTRGAPSAGPLPGAPSRLRDTGPHALFAARDDCWIGVLIPKRWAKRAVTRNAIKRQIYAVSHALQPPLPAAAHVVRLRAGFDRRQFESATSDALKRAVRGELQELFARAGA